MSREKHIAGVENWIFYFALFYSAICKNLLIRRVEAMINVNLHALACVVGEYKNFQLRQVDKEILHIRNPLDFIVIQVDASQSLIVLENVSVDGTQMIVA